MTTATKTTTNSQMQKQLQEMGMELAAMKEHTAQKDELEKKDQELSELRKEVAKLSDLVIHIKNNNEYDATNEMPDRVISIDDGVIARVDTETVNEAPSKDWIEHQEFLKEMVEIHLSPAQIATTNLKSQMIVSLSVNGKPMTLIRGQNYTLPRCYLQALARCKKAHFIEVEDENAFRRGRNLMQYVRNWIDEFPFSVINDSEKGIAWLKEIRNSAS